MAKQHQAASHNHHHDEISEDTRTLVTVLLLIFAYPVGLIVMWVWSNWSGTVKALVTLPLIFIISILMLIFFVFGTAILSAHDYNQSWQTRRSEQLMTPAPLTPNQYQ